MLFFSISQNKNNENKIILRFFTLIKSNWAIFSMQTQKEEESLNDKQFHFFHLAWQFKFLFTIDHMAFIASDFHSKFWIKTAQFKVSHWGHRKWLGGLIMLSEFVSWWAFMEAVAILTTTTSTYQTTIKQKKWQEKWRSKVLLKGQVIWLWTTQDERIRYPLKDPSQSRVLSNLKYLLMQWRKEVLRKLSICHLQGNFCDYLYSCKIRQIQVIFSFLPLNIFQWYYSIFISLFPLNSF